MRLFFDASVSPALATALEVRGFDVVAQRQILRANSPDTDVLKAAWDDQRAIVARDYDMAELVLRGFARAVGVVILAFDAPDTGAEADRIAHELNVLGDQVLGAICIIETSRVRHRPSDLST